MWNFSPFRKTRTETLIEEGERKLRSGKVFSPSKSAEKSPQTPKNKRSRRKSDEFSTPKSTGRQSLKSTFESNSNLFINNMVENNNKESEKTSPIGCQGRTRSGRVYSPVKKSRESVEHKSPQIQNHQDGKCQSAVDF